MISLWNQHTCVDVYSLWCGEHGDQCSVVVEFIAVLKMIQSYQYDVEFAGLVFANLDHHVRPTNQVHVL